MKDYRGRDDLARDSAGNGISEGPVLMASKRLVYCIFGDGLDKAVLHPRCHAIKSRSVAEWVNDLLLVLFGPAEQIPLPLCGIGMPRSVKSLICKRF